MPTKEDILDAIAGMTVLELKELKEAFEERFGVTAAAPMAAMQMVAGGGEAAPVVEEQDEFDVVLLAELAGLMAAPTQQFVNLLDAIPRDFVYALNALIEKNESAAA